MAKELNFAAEGNFDAPDATITTDVANSDLQIQVNGSDIQLVDTNGNALAVWDESAGAWDFSGQDVTGVGALTTGDTATKTIGGGRVHYTADYDGVDADTRLDNALSAASNGDLLILESAEFVTTRTGSGSVSFSGRIMGVGVDNAPEFRSDVEFDGEVVFNGVRVAGGATVTFNGDDSRILSASVFSTVSINADRVTVAAASSTGTITYQNGTVDGEAGPLSGGLTVTDNGSNNILT